MDILLRRAPRGAPEQRETVQRQARLAALILTLLAVIASAVLAEAADAGPATVAAGVTFAICGAGWALVLNGLRTEHFGHARFGLCNVITASRASGVAVLLGLLAVPATVAALGWGLVVFALVVLCLDFFDGPAARRSGLTSAFGARFDMETDVAFALTLAAIAVQLGNVGWWFMALGALRPAFLVGGFIWPWLRAPLAPALWRKSVAAVQMSVQVILILPVMSSPVSDMLAGALLAGVALSFCIDIRALARRRV